MNIREKFLKLKATSGTHSPSIATLRDELPQLDIEVDACFLSNPYATDLFMGILNDRLLKSKQRFREVLEYYPSQNHVLASLLSPVLGVRPDEIFLGNGAIEIIQAVLRNFGGRRALVPIPTFSSYYEFFHPGDVVFHKTYADFGFMLNPERLLADVDLHRPDTVVIINPNNPDGSYLSQDLVTWLLSRLKHVPLVVLDESFIHFAYETTAREQICSAKLVLDFPNLVVLKSMSKDFGIAGIRAGYATMSADRVRSLTSNGFLWNVSGLAEFFFRTYVEGDFLAKYEHCRQKYLVEASDFFAELQEIGLIRTFPSRANFCLVELLGQMSADEVTVDSLINHGVYFRTASDKIGLPSKNFIRIAARTSSENKKIIKALREVVR
jgi:histidinol-phosphate/aromatic aminotransferase/cobyric acid decarboxylase-like protein